jgi:phage tail-like protein
MAQYNPPVGFHFKVEFGLNGLGDSDVRFQEVAGLTAEIGVEELSEGGENRYTHRLPTKAKYANLVLKRGMLVNSSLIQWFKDAVENFTFSPVDVQVTLLDETHQPLSAWSFQKAYPVKWVISDLKAQENALVVETIELAYKYFRRL